ncbi:MAG: MopE-related protein, partial [Deltaproteobacteria bacterium]
VCNGAGTCGCPVGQTNCGGICRATGAACTAGVGACLRSGTIACAGTSTACNAVAGTGVAETCNNIDDNCDGLVDNIVSAGCVPATECRTGATACLAGGLVCNPFGNSVAGTACASISGGVCNGAGACGCAAGQSNCGGSCRVTGAACTAGVGACLRSGAIVCSGTGTACSAVAGTAVTETCNNIDDNCDGLVDNGVTLACYTGAAGTSGVGLCHGGTQTCSAGSFGVCTGQVTPVAELCGNGLDDDCNGVVDNGCVVSAGQVVFTTVGTSLFTVPAGVTQVSVVVVGGGGAGTAGTGNIGGGGGGGLCYLNNITVVPGSNIPVVVGAGGTGGTAGGASSFNGTLIANGGAGSNTATGGAGGNGSGGTCFTGGTGGSFTGGGGPYHAGGGGAAGYTGNGGNGGWATGGLPACPTASTAGSGGGGGGGGGGSDLFNCGGGYGGGGGGVGLTGLGTSGAAGANTCTSYNNPAGNTQCAGWGYPGQGGSTGTAASGAGGIYNTATGTGTGSGGAGGSYGGGGGSDAGAQGGIRVMWGGGRTYPSGIGLYHGYADPGIAGCVITSYNTTVATNLGGIYPYNAGDSNACRAWKLAATVCTTAPVQYAGTTNDWSCPVSGGFTDPAFGTYCLVANQYSCSGCPGACNAACIYNPLSLRNCSGAEASQP